MTEFSFEDIRFVEKDDFVRAVFLTHYYFDISNFDLQKIGRFRVENNNLIFENGKSIEKKFNRLITKGFSELYCNLTGRKAVYVHSNSGIPLLGTSYFGIVDRNSNLIEIRPNTGCNLNCIYCSVNEGGEKAVDFVVEKDYIVQELKKLIEFKDDNDIEIHINPQGEPLLYHPLKELVRDVSRIAGVKRISIDTNAALLTKQRADELMDAGLTQFNVSIDSLDKAKASEIAQCNYPMKQIKEIISYIAKNGNIIITPLLIPRVNNDEIEDLIAFAKENNIRIGLQNFLNYKQGRNPVKQIAMEDFYEKLKELEKKFSMKLIYRADDFGVHKTKELPSPIKKNEILDCHLVSKGRTKNEYLGVSKDRVIEIRDVRKIKSPVKAKIIRTKHNIFRAYQVAT